MPDLLTIVEPATEGVLAEVPRAGAAEVDEAVSRARRALPAWRAVAPARRAALLRSLADTLESHLEELALIEARNAAVPMGHMGDGWDVAHAVLFLASDEARFVTATEIIVDGGSTAAMP